MNVWIEALLASEDMRRRCAAHGQWMREHPDAVAFSEAWAERNLGEPGEPDPRDTRRPPTRVRFP